jgi:diguanylate cyclase (GGDEF)-like protein
MAMRGIGNSTRRTPERPIAFRVIVVYLVAGGIWILLSDRLLGLLITDPMLLTRLQTYKGWLFIFVTACLLYPLIRRYVRTLRTSEEARRLQSCYDPLTGLPNERLFHERLVAAMTEARQRTRELEVIYLDFDRFRTLVRAVGHSAGQELLQAVGSRLAGCLEKEETLAHVGGDEFICLALNVERPEQPIGIASRLLDALKEPFICYGQPVHLTASIGIAIYPFDGEDGDTLLGHAYAAMCRAKELGGNHFQFYFPQLGEYSLSPLILENHLRKALDSEEFILRYQPQLDLDTGRIGGMEVLVSWKHPEHPGLSPAEFIPLAEQTGLIQPIGEWVLRGACTQNLAWQKAGLPPLRMAVNVSARQFYGTNLVDLVQGVLAETGLAPEWLELEITESLLLQDIDEAISILKRLKAIGVGIAIDDFGTGYSSLSYLKQLPVDTLKLDRSFVIGLPHNADDAAITAAVIAMAHVLEIMVVAEGVEREEQRDYLQAKGCDKIQGFLCSPPLPAEEFGRLWRQEQKVGAVRGG